MESKIEALLESDCSNVDQSLNDDTASLVKELDERVQQEPKDSKKIFLGTASKL